MLIYVMLYFASGNTDQCELRIALHDLSMLTSADAAVKVKDMMPPVDSKTLLVLVSGGGEKVNINC